ncbi:MAG: serine/threonine-protein kinase [Isosphaeraceae bacterium]|nr:serine/threonine-protein kinase [Isosphaeraceae bacterium]
MPGCPSEASLSLLGSEALDDDAFAALERHVEQCFRCRAVLERLAGESLAEKTIAAPQAGGPEGLPAVLGYAVEHELGRGGMGVVYRARDLNLGRDVALKFVPGGPLAGPRGRAQWLSEAQALSRISHPNVVRIFDVEETDEWLVLVLEFIGGGSLKDRLAEPVAPRIAAGLAETIARAVEAIHQRGLRHLDLKPSNILLEGDPGAPLESVVPKISDFGIAWVEGDPGASASSLAGPRGTPSYMAPEQTAASRSTVGRPADVYALGALLYHLLTGRPPFQAATLVETLDLIRGQEPVPPRQLNARIPRDLETVCLTCLQKLPGRRYGSAADLADDLRRWLDGRPIAARPVSRLERTWRWCRRRPAIASLVAALSGTIVASFLGLLVLLGRAETARERAQENERIAARTLKELNALIVFDLNEPNPIREDRLLPLIDAARAKARGIQGVSQADTTTLASLASLDRYLGMRLAQRDGRLAEARTLYAESVALWTEFLKRTSNDQEVRRSLAHTVLESGGAASHDGAAEAAEQLYAQALLLAETIEPATFRNGVAMHIADFRRHAAYQRSWSGKPDQARRLLEADLRMFDSLPAASAQDPQLQLRKALTLMCLKQPADARRLVRALAGRLRNEPFPERLRMSHERIDCLAEWVLLEATHLSFSNGSVLPAGEDTDADAWAQQFLASIQEQYKALGEDELMVPAAAWIMADLVQTDCAAKRREKQLAEATRTERVFLAVAHALVRRYGAHAESYLVLSEARLQTAKNAWQRDDDATAKQALRQALDAAYQAARLDPGREDVRRLVADRERRLARVSNDAPPDG